MISAGLFRRAAIVAAVLTLTFTAGMVRPSGAPLQQSVERPLTVDFYALGADGVSIADLKPEEVTIKVNGRTRAVRSLRLVRQAELPSDDPLAAQPMAAPTPFGTNNIAEAGRTFIIVIEDESFRPGRERPIRAAISRFLGAITPADRVSLWTMPHGGMKVDLTRNHDRVSAAMQFVVGHGPDRETGSDAACRTRWSLAALENLLSMISGGEGPSTVMVFTSSMMGPRRDAAMPQSPGMCELRADDFEKVGKMAASARAHVYVIQPEDLVGQLTVAAVTASQIAASKGSENPLEGIENLAGVTGGTRMSLTKLGDASLVQIARATASYYAAVVDGAAADIEGAHGLDVKVTRSGVEVRSRARMYIRRPEGVTPQPKTPAEMIKLGSIFPELQLRASAFSSLNGGDGLMRVVSAAEPVDPSVKLTAVTSALFDMDGKLAAQFNATAAELADVPTLAAMVVPPGTYRLRVAATDSAGRSGAVDTEVVAEVVQAGTLKMSSLVLGLSRGGAFQPRLQFSSEPVAIAYLELFGLRPGTAVGAIVEVSATLNGPPLVVNRLAVAATSDAWRYIATGAIPIGALPPGDYVARVIVGVDKEMYGRVVRAFRKIGQ